MLSFAVMIVAGLAAGALNALAGGGTFITFPTLVWLGVPPVMANATATLTALPGYLSSAWAYRHEMAAEGALSLRAMFALSVLGGLLGAILLLVTPSELFVGVVPWLLLLATVLFALAPRLVSGLSRTGRMALAPAALLQIGVSIYGGYFNGGLGIMLLAAFGLMGFVNLHGMNGLKNVLSAVLSSASVVTYAVAGLIAWDSALVLAIATTVGGYLGSRYARRVRNMSALRYLIVAIGALMAIAFFLQ